jgi:hypothetical protein
VPPSDETEDDGDSDATGKVWNRNALSGNIPAYKYDPAKCRSTGR